MFLFCSSAFFSGIVILVFAAAFSDIHKYIPVAIWTAGMAVGMLAFK